MSSHQVPGGRVRPVPPESGTSNQPLQAMTKGRTYDRTLAPLVNEAKEDDEEHAAKLLFSPSFHSRSGGKEPRMSNGAVYKLIPEHLRHQSIGEDDWVLLQSKAKKRATREIAALDFLLNIPMRSETLSKQSELQGTVSRSKGDQHSEDGQDESDGLEETIPDDFLSPDFINTSSVEHVPGRRLRGRKCRMVSLPAPIRHRLLTHYSEQSSEIHRWEMNTLRKGLLDGRVYFSGGQGYPTSVFSVIKYAPARARSRYKRPQAIALEPSSFRYDWRGKSYSEHLHARWTRCSPERDARSTHPHDDFKYDPLFVDNPDVRQGKHRQVLTGSSKTGPVLSSILLFVKPRVLKEELNWAFRESHPSVDPSLTLSKIRNLKREALVICLRNKIEVSTAALANIFFEKLVLKKQVKKSNRKLIMAACLLLAFKFNTSLKNEELKLCQRQFLYDIDRTLRVSPREIMAAEFVVFSELDFSLHLQLKEIHPHFIRLLKMLDTAPRTYLGYEMYTTYTEELLKEEEQDGQDAGEDEEDEEEEGIEDEDEEDEEDEDEGSETVSERSSVSNRDDKSREGQFQSASQSYKGSSENSSSELLNRKLAEDKKTHSELQSIAPDAEQSRREIEANMGDVIDDHAELRKKHDKHKLVSTSLLESWVERGPAKGTKYSDTLGPGGDGEEIKGSTDEEVKKTRKKRRKEKKKERERRRRRIEEKDAEKRKRRKKKKKRRRKEREKKKDIQAPTANLGPGAPPSGGADLNSKEVY